MIKKYQLCTKTVMDTSDPDIQFDKDGVCNYYYEYQEKSSKILLHGKERELAFNEVVDQIKQSGKNKQYDCLIGLSGGVDSSYIAYMAGEMGLRPLIVHFDNGWNSELAVSNIEKLVNKYNFDLHTLVVDWQEFKDIQLSLFKSSVPNIEIVTDHAIIATLYRVAKKYDIQYLISGSNIVTEGILPSSWGYDASDFYHIKAIHKQFGKVPIKTFPHLSLGDYFYFNLIRKIKKVNILNYIEYSKADAIKQLTENVGWQYYGGKHFESIFTQFFQAHVLPEKFGFDKRRAHLSTLICSGQITRKEALEELEQPLYKISELKEHTEYIIKKWGITNQEYDNIMKSPAKLHDEYPSNKKWVALAVKYKRMLKL